MAERFVVQYVQFELLGESSRSQIQSSDQVIN